MGGVAGVAGVAAGAAYYQSVRRRRLTQSKLIKKSPSNLVDESHIYI